MSGIRLVDEYTHELLMAINGGASLEDAMRAVSLKHAEHLKELGSVRVLALDPCPRCGGQVIASEIEARCAGCDWSHRRHAT